MTDKKHVIIVFRDGETWAPIKDARIVELTDAEFDKLLDGDVVRHFIDIDEVGIEILYEES